MNELREQCLKIIESLEETIEHNAFDYHCLNEEKAIHLLEAFASEQRIQALQKAKLYISIRVQDRNEHRHCVTPAHQNRDSIRNGEIQIMDQWIDAEIQRMLEEGEHVHSGESRDE